MIYQRRSHRLRGYDYSRPGAYFLTLKTFGNQHLFGTIRSDTMILSDGGRVARQCWHAIPDHFPMVHLDAYVIMPDHIHGILWIADDDYMGFRSDDVAGLCDVVVDEPADFGISGLGEYSRGVGSSVGHAGVIRKHAGDDELWGAGQYPGDVVDAKHVGANAEHVGAKNFSPLHVSDVDRWDPNIHFSPIIDPRELPSLVPVCSPARFSWVEHLSSDAMPFKSPSRTIGSIVRGFKIGVTKELRWKQGIYPVWQRDYWDAIICSEISLWRTRRYILENPERWVG